MNEAKPAGGCGRLADWLLWLLVFAAGFLALAAVQLYLPFLPGYDAYYHTAAAELIRDRGLVDSLPWVEVSLYRTRYADTELLFHLALIPFVSLHRLYGPKLFIMLVSALLVLLSGIVARRMKLPLAWLVPFLLLAGGIGVELRLNLCRPHLFAFGLVLLLLWALHSASSLGLFLVGFAFPLCYVAFHLPLIIAGMWFAASLLSRSRLPWKETAAVAAGVALGLLVHPYRDNLLYIWWVLMAGDLTDMVWSINPPVSEFLPASAGAVFFDTGLTIPLLLAAGAAWLYTRQRPGRRTIFCLLLFAAFTVLYFSYRRFVLYWVAFGSFAALGVIGDCRIGEKLGRLWTRHRMATASLFAVFFFLLAGNVVKSVMGLQRADREEIIQRFEGATGWMNSNLPAGSFLFHCEWDATPFLAYHAPGFRYMNVLSPNFSIAYSPCLHLEWENICLGKSPDAAMDIALDFGASFVLVERNEGNDLLMEELLRDWRVLELYRDEEAAIFEILWPDACVPDLRGRRAGDPVGGTLE
ncbi:MAG: hypothetical protein D6806_17045 [Deltaproteobacteria bacterium]|nr:MAG: hypothetical protein D6806_17045 [Deltaproteobacteria bacterium]